MKREETIGIPWVSLTPDDLAAIASRMTARFMERRREAEADYDAQTATEVARYRRWVAQASERAKKAKALMDEVPRDENAELYRKEVEVERREKRELKAFEKQRAAERDAQVSDTVSWYRPAFSVATKQSSFTDHDWPALWERVSSHDIRSIELRDPNLGETVIEVRIDVMSRSAGRYSNSVKLTSTNEAEFDAEYGAFMGLFRDRAAKGRKSLTTGVPGFLMWLVVPGLVLSAIYVGIHYRSGMRR